MAGRTSVLDTKLAGVLTSPMYFNSPVEEVVVVMEEGPVGGGHCAWRDKDDESCRPFNEKKRYEPEGGPLDGGGG